MAAIPAARPSTSPAAARKAPKASASSSASRSQRPVDPFYGHQETSLLCARFVSRDLHPSPLPLTPQISSLFQCPNIPTATHPGAPTPTLAHFVAYALHRTRLPSVVTFAALLLLHRLKARFPAARGSSGHRLFISAFMIASKVICDDTYSNQSWCIVGQKLFTLKEINQMEREMCGYLEWNVNVAGDEVADLEARVRAEHGSSQASSSSTKTFNVFEPTPIAASCAAAAAAAAAYPSPEATPSSRPIRPVPTPYTRRAGTPASASACPSPTSSLRNAYMASHSATPSHLSPHHPPPALASASSSLASSPASDDCKTPSPVALVGKPKRPASHRSASKTASTNGDYEFASHARHAAAAMQQPLSVGGW